LRTLRHRLVLGILRHDRTVNEAQTALLQPGSAAAVDRVAARSSADAGRDPSHT
jgi:hypothetical protein